MTFLHVYTAARLDGLDGESNAFLYRNACVCISSALNCGPGHGNRDSRGNRKCLRKSRAASVYPRLGDTAASLPWPLPPFLRLREACVSARPARGLTISRQANINNVAALTVLARPEGKRGKCRRNLRATLDLYVLDAIGESISFFFFFLFFYLVNARDNTDTQETDIARFFARGNNEFRRAKLSRATHSRRNFLEKVNPDVDLYSRQHAQRV